MSANDRRLEKFEEGRCYIPFAQVNNVKLGPQYGDSWVIESGLAGGSLVIEDNLQKLREGAPVDPHVAQYRPSATSQITQPTGR